MRKYFTVTGEVKVQDGVYEFYTLVDQSLEADFKKLVADLKPIGFIPVIGKSRDHGSDYVISVIKKRNSKPFGIWINLLLLIATLVSTIYVGRGLYTVYFGIYTWVSYFYGFLYFSLPLLIILGAHELGHFYMAKKSGVAASLPFVLGNTHPYPPGAICWLRCMSAFFLS